MKKFLVFMVLLFAPAFADRIHVEALEDFSSKDPSEYFTMKITEDANINNTFMLAGDILNCTVKKIVDPTRAKRDAKIYFLVNSYTDSKGEHEFNPKLIGKYSKTALTKEEIKKIPPKKAITKTAGTVGSFFVKGLSYGVSFVDGAVENNEGNRLKSGAKQMYQDSIFSYVEMGHDVNIKKGDTFYLYTKQDSDDIQEITTEYKKEQAVPLPADAPQDEQTTETKPD